MARIAKVWLLGLTLLCVACGNRAGDGSASGRGAVASGASTDGGGGTGSAASCATLLPSSVRPEVFVLPQDTWVQQRQSILRCDTQDFAASDSMGNLAFLVATYGNPAPDARLYVMNPATGAIQIDDVPGTFGPWTAGVQGLTTGFLGGLFFIAPIVGYHLVWYEHGGLPTGARHDNGPGPGEFLGVLPDGRVMVLNVPADAPEQPRLEEYEGDGGLRWSTELVGERDLVGLRVDLSVDLEGRTLLVQPAVDGGVSLAWVDENGVLGPVFGGPLGLVDALPRAEGGFFLLQQQDSSLFPRWLGMVASGATTIEPAPDWLPTPGNSGPDWFRVAPARDGYVIASLYPTQPILEVRSVAGELCGHVDLVPADGRIVGLGHTTIGADGTVFVSGYSCAGSSSLAASLQANAGSQVCTCAWQYWPALLH